MSSDTDLYPPDLEVVTPEARDARNRAMVGTFLVVIGTGLLLERTFSTDLDFFWLGVGAALIAGWLQAPRFLMFAVGSIMTGFAVGGFLDSVVSLPFQGAFETLIAGAGFLAVYVRYPLRARWALIPAGISAVVAAAEAGVELIGFIPSVLTGAMLPLLLIAGGALLLMRHALPPRLVRIGLIVVAVAFIATAASSVDRWDNGPRLGAHFGPPLPFGQHEYDTVVDLDGRTLIVETEGGSIDVTTTAGGDARITALASRIGPSSGIEVDEDDDEVRVLVRHDIPTSWRIAVPEGTDLELSSETGLIKLAHTGGDVAVENESGAVIVTLDEDRGRLAVTNDRGMIQILGDADDDPSITAETDDGSITGPPGAGGDSFTREGSGAELELENDEGQIVIVGLAA